MDSQSYTAHEGFWTDIKMGLSMFRLAILFSLLINLVKAVKSYLFEFTNSLILIKVCKLNEKLLFILF